MTLFLLSIIDLRQNYSVEMFTEVNLLGISCLQDCLRFLQTPESEFIKTINRKRKKKSETKWDLLIIVLKVLKCHIGDVKTVNTDIIDRK